MRIIDADALMDDIKRDSKKAIDEGDKVGSFWLGYAAGLVIKQPTIQPVATDVNVGNNSEFPNGSDIISRQAAIDAIDKQIKQCCKALGSLSLSDADKHAVEVKMASLRAYRGMLENLPTIQPVATDANVGDTISKFIDGLEETFAYIREREGGDSVCGLCEYDGAYIGQSGDWCNECPGFNRDDCFKLSDETRRKWTEEIIKALPSVQPEPHEGHWIWVAGDLECSKCHTRYPDLYPDYDNAVACPHCGAKMKGEPNERFD